MERKREKILRQSAKSYFVGFLVFVAVVGIARIIWLVTPDWSGFGDKTLWDLLELIIIPVVLAAGVIWFEWRQRESERDIAYQRAENDRKIANERSRDEILQGFLDKMTELILDKGLKKSDEGAEVRDIARARTLTTLRGLDKNRKGTLLRFLKDTDLISANAAIINMEEADLSDLNLLHVETVQEFERGGSIMLPRPADLSKIALAKTNLSGANLSFADLTGADLRNANLFQSTVATAILSSANLEEAILIEANLTYSIFENANLKKSRLFRAHIRWSNLQGTDLSDTDLRHADLREAKLQGANLSRANLSFADFTGAEVSVEQLARAERLSDAILPDGKRYDGRFSLAGDN